MNHIHEERIRKIADEAGELCSKNSDEPWGMLDWECKFAELIVKEMVDECAKVCVEHAGWTPRMIAEQVKQHFGVEE
jgi:hypothetical protein